MAQKRKQPDDIHEHNRKVLGDLLFAHARWLAMPEASRRLKPIFGAKTTAKLLASMRSGALPTALRRVWLRDGIPVSHVTSHYPKPAEWNDVGSDELKILEKGPWQSRDGDRVFIQYAYVDLERFNAIFFAQKVEHVPNAKSLKRRIAMAILNRLYKEKQYNIKTADGYKIATADLVRQFEPYWDEECANQHADPKAFTKPNRDFVDRMLGRRV